MLYIIEYIDGSRTIQTLVCENNSLFSILDILNDHSSVDQFKVLRGTKTLTAKDFEWELLLFRKWVTEFDLK